MNQNRNDGNEAGLLVLVGLGLAGLGIHRSYAGGGGRFLADLTEALRRAKETPQMAASAPPGEIPIGERTLLQRRRRVRHRLAHLRGRQMPTARTLLHVPPKQIAASIEVPPPAKTNKLEKPPRHKAPRAVVQRICNGVRELQAKRLGCPVEKLDTLAKDERVRLTRDEWMEIVRAEYPGVNWGFVQQVRTQVYDFKRSKTKND